MKIITNGKENWKREVNCSDCKSILEIDASDVEYWIHHDYGGGHDSVVSVKCVVCNHDIRLGGEHDSDVPYGIITLAKKKYLDEHKK